MEHDIWQGKLHPMGVLALMLDILANAAGVWFLVNGIDNTDVWRMLTEVFAVLPETIPSFGKFSFAVIAGAVIAFAPEAVWK
jgi:hypothetical protein